MAESICISGRCPGVCFRLSDCGKLLIGVVATAADSLTSLQIRPKRVPVLLQRADWKDSSGRDHSQMP